jgi:hypothetical protein
MASQFRLCSCNSWDGLANAECGSDQAACEGGSGLLTHTSAPSTGARLARDPSLPHEIWSATGLGTRQGDRRAAREGTTAPRGIGRHGRYRHLQPDPFRARQADRRVGVSPLGLGPTSSARSKSQAARVGNQRTPAADPLQTRVMSAPLPRLLDVTPRRGGYCGVRPANSCARSRRSAVRREREALAWRRRISQRAGPGPLTIGR